jgi:lipopolysaccharide transport system permease protein
MQKIIITPQANGFVAYLKKIYRYRTLIIVFAKRDLKVKYAQTFLGLGWSIVQPLTALFIYTFFFGYLLQWKAGTLPFSLYVLSGLMGWNFFSYVVFQGTASLQESEQLIKKIYFPKAVLPLSKILVALVELGITLTLFIPLMLWHRQAVSWHIVLLPLLLFANAMMSLFVVFFITALAYRKRDLFHLVPFLMYFGIWCTPVFFTPHILPEKINFIWYFNPMASIVEGWRWCLFPDWRFDTHYIPALVSIIPLFILGLTLYAKTEKDFSDFV